MVLGSNRSRARQTDGPIGLDPSMQEIKPAAQTTRWFDLGHLQSRTGLAAPAPPERPHASRESRCSGPYLPDESRRISKRIEFLVTLIFEGRAKAHRYAGRHARWLM